MATYTTRTVTSTRREWIVPAAEPWGADSGEVMKALRAAHAAYCEASGYDPAATLPDDVLRFHVRDDEIVIAFTVEVTTEVTAPAPVVAPKVDLELGPRAAAHLARHLTKERR